MTCELCGCLIGNEQAHVDWHFQQGDPVKCDVSTLRHWPGNNTDSQHHCGLQRGHEGEHRCEVDALRRWAIVWRG